MGNATSKTKKGKKNKSGDGDAKEEQAKVDDQKASEQQKVSDQPAGTEAADSAKATEGATSGSGGSGGSSGGAERKKSPSQIVRDIQHDPTVGRYLKHVPLLSKLKDSDRDKVGGALELLEYKEDSNVFEQGEDGHGFYVIKSGTVSITRTDPESKEKSELARLGAGDYFGETALLKNEKRGGTATCVGPCEIFFLDKDKFFALFGEDKINVQFAVRRVAISAEQMLAGLVREDIKKPAQAVIDKTEAQAELIMNSIESNVLFQNLTREQQTKLLAEFYQTEIKEGKSVVTQGEMGLHFYIVETGAFDVVVTDADTKVAKKVASRGPGQCFGELALMYNAPRAATVTATADSLVWMLDRFTFRRIAQDVGANALNRYLQFMQSVDLLSPLAEYEREKIAEALEEVHFRRGTAIFKQGDEGDAMYIIEEGEVRVTKLDDGKEEEEVNRIRKGDYFGERALLNNEPRAATVTAVLDTYCLKLDRNAFSLLLGPLEEIMKKKISSYDAKEEEEKIQPLSTEYKFTDLETVGTLGKGSFGFVTLVRHKPSGGAFALKAVSKAQIVETSQQGHIMSEKRVMQTLQHPFLIRLYATYKDRNLLYFLLEPSLGGELFTVLRKHRLFSEPTARFYAGCVIMAFEYMHSREYIYRDLKPENLLLDAEGYIKVTDFGFAKKIKNKTWTLCGTPEYLAPEIVGGKGHGKGVDWWTVGVLIYEMLASYTPFYHDDHMKMYAKIAKGKYQFPSHFTKEAKGLVRDLLQVQPTKRLGVVRGGATLIKESPFFKGFDWQKLYEKKLKGPIQPKIKNPFDLANFDESDDRQHHVKPYNDDGTNWDADF